MKTLFWDQTGPLISYDEDNKVLHVADLNPDLSVRWSFSRWELLKVGLRCIWQAVR